MAASCFRSLPAASSLETSDLPAAWQCREGQTQRGGASSVPQGWCSHQSPLNLTSRRLPLRAGAGQLVNMNEVQPHSVPQCGAFLKPSLWK